MSPLRHHALPFAALALLWACDAREQPATLDPGVPTIEAIGSAPDLPAPPALTRLEVGTAVTCVADDDGVVVAGTSQGLFSLDGPAMAPLAVVADPGSPATTGPTVALARRRQGLLVSAEGGLFHTFERVLLRSPASAALAGATALAVTGDGADETTWAALPDGLHRLDADAHERIVFPDPASAAPSAIAAHPDVVLVAFGERLYELAPAALTYRTVPAALGPITHATGAGDRLFVGGPDGLLERRADGSYRHYTALAPVLALTADAVGIAYARTPGGVFRLDPSGPVALTAVPPTTAEYVGLVLDRDGQLWLGDGAALVRLATGRVVSFADDIAPIFEARCGACHAEGDGAPRRDFADYDLALALSEAIFTRVSTGLMPPPSSPPLTADEYDLLVRWYAGDRAP